MEQLFHVVNDLWFVISTPSNTKCAKKNKVINLWPRDLISEKGERQNMEVLSSKKVDHIRLSCLQKHTPHVSSRLLIMMISQFQRKSSSEDQKLEEINL